MNKDNMTEKEFVVTSLVLEYTASKFMVNKDVKLDTKAYMNLCEKWVNAFPDFTHAVGEFMARVQEYREANKELPRFVENVLNAIFEDIENYWRFLEDMEANK